MVLVQAMENRYDQMVWAMEKWKGKVEPIYVWVTLCKADEACISFVSKTSNLLLVPAQTMATYLPVLAGQIQAHL